MTWDNDRRMMLAHQMIECGEAPRPIPFAVTLTEDGYVSLPVPDATAAATDGSIKHVTVLLHAGCTLQWTPMSEAGGVLVQLRGGIPDGDETRDAVAAFFTLDGLDRLAADLIFISTVSRAADKSDTGRG